MAASTIKACGKTHIITEGPDTVATSQALGKFLLPNGDKVQVKRAFVTATTNATTDLVTAVANAAIRVVSGVAISGATAPTVTFKSHDGSTGTAISPAFTLPVNGGFVLPVNLHGWVQTLDINTTLQVAVSSSADVAVIVNYIEIPQDCFDLL